MIDITTASCATTWPSTSGPWNSSSGMTTSGRVTAAGAPTDCTMAVSPRSDADGGNAMNVQDELRRVRTERSDGGSVLPWCMGLLTLIVLLIFLL